MLKLAYVYKDKLNQQWQNCIFNSKYQFFNFNDSNKQCTENSIATVIDNIYADIFFRYIDEKGDN